jgi:glycosyltransferase involved in cell wall biosynthesis
MFTSKTSLIIPTKNRSEQIIELINKLVFFKIEFNEIIIVDSSNIDHAKKIQIKCEKNNIKYYHTRASTSYQRNFGLTKIKHNNYVMFMDDDVILLDDTFQKMDQCIDKYGADSNIGGFGFNQTEDIKYSFFEKLKNISLIRYLDIYPSVPGKIARSGWHSRILNLKEDVLADWVFTTICIYKREDIKNFKFDESFGEYSYLEDLDFSLNLMKENKKIYISSEAKFLHPENIDRSGFRFGIVEIVNRYKIIKKYKLSKKLFIIGSLIRFFMSLIKSLSFNKKYFFRCMGNIYSLLHIAKE